MKDTSFFRERVITVVMLGLACYFSISTCIHKQAQNNLLTTIVERKTDTIRIKTDTIIYLKSIAWRENYFQNKTEFILRDSIRLYKGLLAENEAKFAATKKEIPMEDKSEKNLKKELDSLKRLAYVYKDKYLNISLFPSDSLKRDSLYFNYDVHLTAKNYITKQHWYNAKKSYTDITSQDQRVTIMGKKTYTIQQLKSSYGLRLRGLADYNFSLKTLSLGLGTMYDFGRKGQYTALSAIYYNITTGKFEPVASLRYDFKTF